MRAERLRGQRVVRRLYLGEATAAPEGWEHLRTVVRVQTQTFDASEQLSSDRNPLGLTPPPIPHTGCVLQPEPEPRQRNRSTVADFRRALRLAAEWPYAQAR